MSGPVPFIDARLGRSLARQSARKVDSDLHRVLDRAMRSRILASRRPRPSQRFRENLRVFDRDMRGCVVASLDTELYLVEERRFEPARVLIAWDVFDTASGHRRIALGNVNISRRTGELCARPSGAVIVSEHSMQRIFQRLRTMETRAALRELGDAAALGILFILSRKVFERGKTCFAATPNGLAFAETDLDTGKITTLIYERKLRPEQRAAWAPGPLAKDVGVRFYSSARQPPATGHTHKTGLTTKDVQ